VPLQVRNNLVAKPSGALGVGEKRPLREEVNIKVLGLNETLYEGTRAGLTRAKEEVTFCGYRA
jgi:hypothetical protein